MARVIIADDREGYGIDQVRDTMTVGELVALLQDYDEDAPIYLSHDNGFTFGGITERKIEEVFDDE